MISLAGLDTNRYLSTNDPLVRVAMDAIAQRHMEIRDDLAENDAVRIANAVGRMLGG